MRAILTFTLLFSLIIPFNSVAQTLGLKRYSADTRYDVSISYGVPVTYLPSSVDADFRYQKDYTKSHAIFLDIGLTYFIPNKALILSSFNQGALFIPVKGGGKIFLTERLYLSAEVGAAFRMSNLSIPSFIYSPGVGFELNKWIDLGLRYENFTKYNASKIGLKIGCGIYSKREPRYTSWYE